METILHGTTFGDHTAFWQIVRVSRIAVESLADHAATAPAYRMRMDGSIVGIPIGDPGVVFFGEAEHRPDLAQVREWFLEHLDLWNAVRSQYWDAVASRR